ncbi:MAG: ATP-binding protein [Bacilli bacterium]|nr:ATP-binding protein [Bacilli bacterium]
MKNNPFSLEFGVQPPEYIDRFREISEIKEDFSSLIPPTHLYAILGPRGCGKTVMLNDIYHSFKDKEGWIAVDLNCKSDLLLQLAASLDDKVKTFHKDISAEFSFSFSFLSVTLKGKEHVSNVIVLLEKMFAVLSRHNRKVLITIDDVVNNEYVAVFVKQFQSLRGKNMPVFLVMTGIYSAFNRIQGQDGLTFLQRAPKIYLAPLNQKAIAASYQSVLGVPLDEAVKLAAFTKGYAFAYQCLGYLLVKNGKTKIDEEILGKMDYYLEEGVYGKLFEELSEKEKTILLFVASRGIVSNQDLLIEGVLSKDTVSFYKSSLERKGIIEMPARGEMAIALPRFAEFILAQNAMD